MIDRLILFLRKARLDVTAEEISDILWLAAFLPSTSLQDSGAGFHGQSGSDEDARLANTSSTHENAEPGTWPEPTLVLPPEPHPNQEQSVGTPAIGFGSPAPPGLAEKHGLVKSLRPLTIKSPSKNRREFDEVRTVRQIADQRIWQVFTCPALERNVGLDLVIDEHPSMLFWSRVVDEFCQMIEATGVFRTIRFWSLKYESREGTPELFARPRRAKARTLRRRPGELANYSGYRLILLVSDCIAPAWHNGKINPLLETWGAKSFISLLHLLPEEMKWRTGLRNAFSTRIRAYHPVRRNSELIVQRPDLWPYGRKKKLLGIPILRLEPPEVQAWAELASGASGSWHNGYVFPDTGEYMNLPPEKYADENNPDAVLESFRISSSTEAWKLAVYFSATAPLNLPLMRLIQKSTLPASKYYHLIEVLMGGVLKPVSGGDAEKDPEKLKFDFVPYVRDKLRNHLTRDQMLEVYTKTSNFVNKHTGERITFPALLASPEQVSELKISPEVENFAWISPKVLERYGGIYAQLAKRLRAFSTELEQRTNQTLSQGDQGKSDIPEIEIAPAAEPDDEQARIEDLRISQRRRFEVANANPNLFTSLQLLRALDSEVAGDLKIEVDRAVQEKGMQLALDTQRLADRARNTAEKFPRDLQLQEREWREVLLLNPEDEDAKQALQNLTFGRLLRIETAARLEKLLKSAEEAEEADKETQLNEILGELTTLKNQLQEGILPPDLQPEVIRVKEKVTELRNKVRQRLEILATALLEGDYRTALVTLRSYITRGYPTQIISPGGIWGVAGETTPVYKLYSTISNKYIAQIRKKATDRIELAMKHSRANPNQAIAYLNEALSLLQDDVLNLGQRSQLRELEYECEKQLKEGEENKIRYDEAHSKIRKATGSELSAQERLTILRQVGQSFPDYPNLDFYLQQAEADRAIEYAGEIDGIIKQASLIAVEERFDEAVTLLTETHNEVVKKYPNPPADSPLEQKIDALFAEQARITQAKAVYQHMEQTVQEMIRLIQTYTQYQRKKDLDMARQLLESLPEPQREHAKVKAVESRLAALQENFNNWKLGLREYHSGHWTSALEYLQAVKADFKNKTRADKYADRALAVLNTAEAKELEEKDAWSQALGKYQEALDLFTRQGVDRYTIQYEEACREGHARVARIEDNNRPVREKLRHIKARLEKAVSLALRRKDAPLVNKVIPIPGFAEVDKELNDLLEIPSSYESEIQEVISQARKVWIDSYLDGIKAAVRSEDEVLLEKAMQLGEELSKHGLLYEPAHQHLVRDLLVKFLDTQYANLTAALEVDWTRVVNNRKQRMEIRGILPTPEIQNQVRDAVFYSLENQVKRLTKDGQPRSYLDAQSLLNGAFEEDVLARSDWRLIRLLIKLYWQTQDWENGRSTAQLFNQAGIKEGKKLARLWDALTLVAQDLTQNRISTAISSLSNLELEYGELVSGERQELTQNTLDRLVKEARQAELQRSDEGAVQAVELYTLAHLIEPNDLDVLTGFKSLAPRIQASLPRWAELARKLTIGFRDLDAAIREADQLYNRLRIISQAAELLGLDEDESEVLWYEIGSVNKPDTPGRLRLKLARWKQVRGLLKDADARLAEALSVPLPMMEDEYGISGGWDFRPVADQLYEAELHCGADNELLSIIVQRRSELRDKYEHSAQELLNKQIQPLMHAVRQEVFDTVVRYADALDRAWRELRQQNAQWGGLDIMITHDYPTGIRASTPSEHREMASRQTENLARWKRWHDNVLITHERLEILKIEMGNPSNEDIKKNKSLREIIDDCQKAIEACDVFLKAYENKPTGQHSPLSHKAESLAAEFPDAEVEDMRSKEGFRARMIKLADASRRTREEFERLNGPLYKLRQYIGEIRRLAGDPPKKSVRPELLRDAYRYLDECEKIDPHHREVTYYHGYLNNKILGSR